MGVGASNYTSTHISRLDPGLYENMGESVIRAAGAAILRDDLYPYTSKRAAKQLRNHEAQVQIRGITKHGHAKLSYLLPYIH